jgi:hypothetical protein
MSKQPRLEDWFLTDNDLLFGRVYDDPRFPDGTIVRTTRVVELDHATGTARTKFTNYILGKPCSSRTTAGEPGRE